MGNEVHLKEPRPCVCPVGERTDCDLPLQQRAGFGSADAVPLVGVLTERLECAVDRRRTHACHTLLDRDLELTQRVPPTQSIQQLREKRRQTFGTDAVSHQPTQLQQVHLGPPIAR